MPSAVMLLPTPVVTDSQSTRNSTANRKDGTGHNSGDTMTDALTKIDLLPTPAAADGSGGRHNSVGHQTTFPGTIKEIDNGNISWAKYAQAIERWERITGRDAPDPVVIGPKGGRVLNPRLVEWMMGLLPGWVTDIPGLSRAQYLKILGNGVVPQQAEAALDEILTDWVVAS